MTTNDNFNCAVLSDVQIFKMAFFWAVAKCGPVEVTDVSDVLAAFSTRAMGVYDEGTKHL
jgi:hypothetical protein